MKVLFISFLTILILCIFCQREQIEGFKSAEYKDYNQCDETSCCTKRIIDCDNTDRGCGSINRSRPHSQKVSFNENTQSSADQIICSQHQALEKYRKTVKKFHKDRETALKAGQTVFNNPLNEYVEPLMDPTLPADRQPVMKGINQNALSLYGQCTLDAYGNTVCNPQFWNLGPDGLSKSRTDFMDQSTTEPQFLLYKT